MLLPVEEEFAAKIRNHERRLKRLETLDEAGGGDWIHLETKSIVDGTASVTFLSISQNFRHLFIIASVISKLSGAAQDSLRAQFNGDTTSTYGTNIHRANFGAVNTGGVAVVVSDTNAYFGAVPPGSCGASDFLDPCATGILIPQYSATADNTKAWRGWTYSPRHDCLEVTGAARIEDYGGDWPEDEAITQIRMFLELSTFKDESVISLYGIRGT